jgi:hypothetical protein
MQKTARKAAKTAPKNSTPPPTPPDNATPDNAHAIGDAAEFVRNMMRVGVQSQQLLAEFVKRQMEKGNAPLDPLNLTDTFMTLARVEGL